MPRQIRLSKQALALLNHYQERAIEYGRAAVREHPACEAAVELSEMKDRMLLARYRLEQYLVRCGAAAQHGTAARIESRQHAIGGKR